MPTRRWTIPLEGTSVRNSGMVIDPRGRIMVSTRRRAEERAPNGLNHFSTWVAKPDPVTLYANEYAHRCYAIEPSGAVAWGVDGVEARWVAPDGTLVATNDRHELLLLDRDGIETERLAVGAKTWTV